MKTTKLVAAALIALISTTAVHAAVAPQLSGDATSVSAAYLPYTAGMGDPLDLTRPVHGKVGLDAMKTGSVSATRGTYHMPYTGGLGDPDDLTRPVYN